MTRKEFCLLILIAGLTGGLAGGMGLYFLPPSTAVAQTESTFEKEFREFIKSKAAAEEQKREHLKNLKVTEEEGIILKDKMGRRRAALATDHNGVPYLEFYDKDGKTLVSLNSEELRIDSANSKRAVIIEPLMILLRLQSQQGKITKTQSTKMLAGVPEPIETITVCNYNDPSKESLGSKTHDINCLISAGEEPLMTSAKALAKASDECLYDVRDRGFKYDNSPNCTALGALSMQYVDAGGWQDLKSLAEHARIANQAKTTAWMARAVSASGGQFIGIW